MTRVWLTEWEWACCGDAFAVGDEVDFGIKSRSPQPTLADSLGPELVATVDAIESHHEGPLADRVRGRVVAVHKVTREVLERRSLRQPSRTREAPRARLDLGNGAYAVSRPSKYVTEVIPVPDTALLEPETGVRPPAVEHATPARPPRGLTEDPPPEQRARSLAGWLVDIEEH